MGNAIVFAVILALLCYLTTTVDAQRHHRGSVPQRPRNGVSMSVIQIEVFGEGFPLGFSKLCSPPYPFPRWGQPDFLKNVTAEGFKQFCDILTNQNLTKAEMREQLEQWAKDQGSDVYDEFNKYVEEKKRRRENIETNMQQLITDTTKFIEDVKSIMNDMSLTRGEEREKISDLAEKTNRSVLVLAAMIRTEAGFPKRGHHGRPCPWCRPLPPPMPRPFDPNFRPHGPPHFGPGMPEREPDFFGDGFRPNGFRPNEPFGQNQPFGGNRFPFGKHMRWGMNGESMGMRDEEIWSKNDFQDDIFDNE